MSLGLRILALLGLLLGAWTAQAAPTPEDVALGKLARETLAAAAGTPAQEWVLGCANSGRLRGIPLLTGESATNEAQLAAARMTISAVLAECPQRLSWPRPAQIIIPHTDTPPIIDGVPDDKAWQHAVTFTKVYPFNSRQPVPEPATTWRLLWDERYLYASMRCTDTDIIAPRMTRDDDVYNYDCMEILLLPDPAKLKYWEIEVGATGTIYDAVNTKRTTAWGAQYDVAANVTGLRVATSVDGTPNQPGNRDTGYSVEMAIPFDQFPGAAPGSLATPGMRLYGLLTHFDRDAAGLHIYAFCPLLAWVHNIWNYAPMLLQK